MRNEQRLRILIICLFLTGNSFLIVFPQDMPSANFSSEDLVYFLGSDILDSDYFLDEIDIVQSQKKKLRETVEKNSLILVKLMSTAGGEKVDPNAFADFMAQMSQEINSILLPHQFKVMKGKISQREYQKKYGCEPVDLIFIVADRLKLAEHDKQRLLEEAKQIRQSYHDKLSELREQAKEKCLGILPEENLKRLTIYSAIAKGSEAKVKILQARILELAIQEKQFDQVEKLIYAEFIYDLPTNQFARDMLLFNQAQIEEHEASLQLAWSQPNEYSGFFENAKLEAMESMKTGDLDALKKLHDDQQRSHGNQLIEKANFIGDRVLTQKQILAAKEYSQFRRKSLEAGNDDFFGMLAVVGSMEDSKDKAKIKKFIDQASEQFYKNRKKILEDAFNEIFNLIPIPGKEHFIELFGKDMYDYESERLFRKK